MLTFDPDKFINCKEEQALFESMLETPRKGRILSIAAPSGNGKTQLMFKLKHYCDINKIPVCLIRFDQAKAKISSKYVFIETLVTDMESRIDFVNFNRIQDAKLGKNFAGVIAAKSHNKAFGNIREEIGFLSATSNDFRYSVSPQVGYVINNINFSNEKSLEGIEAYLIQQMLQLSIPTEFDDKQNEYTENASIEAFYKDLVAHCKSKSRLNRNQRTIVLLLDMFEECHEKLNEWFLRDFLERCFLDENRRPERMFLVVTGHKEPRYDLYHDPKQSNTIIKSLRNLTKWSLNDIKYYLRLRGVEDEDNSLADVLYKRINKVPTSNLVHAIELLAAEESV